MSSPDTALATNDSPDRDSRDAKALAEEADNTSLSMESVTDGKNARGIPIVKFVEDISAFADSFTPAASAELLIGAFSDLFSKFKAYEQNLSQKRLTFQEKIPEIEKSLALVNHLKKKKDEGESVVTRYNLADTIYTKAELDCSAGIVNLWLGANVMLEYTHDEAIELLSSKLENAKKEYDETTKDLAFTRNQIITAEVNISRIYNWDVRKKRASEV
uniref:Prefoldin subunit 3 n=1 Tax=Pseudictyota dubia TaxID=2749911 RepID=A0A7R9WBY9_9STRA|mmetsp:Transcript_42156/g.78037  ORF Transcript_42156/g.78037 Transcript_42156/m.78037 type:complete len:217 (+) Transcript_42156:103-753(+)